MRTIFAMALLALTSHISGAEEESDEATELAKQLSNPVASLISIPFQANYDFDIGSTGDGSRFTLNIQTGGSALDYQGLESHRPDDPADR